MSIRVTAFVLLLAPLSVLASQECGTDIALAADTPSNRAYLAELEVFVDAWAEQVRGRDLAAEARGADPVYTLPVVVHIVHAGASLGSDANPTDAAVATIVDTASLRFRHSHGGAQSYSNPNYGVDVEIGLALATLDPDGSYSSGVLRYLDASLAAGSISQLRGGLDALTWDKDRYLNLFVVTDLTDAAGVFVGEDFTIYDSGSFWDGLIAHEVGHQLSLPHPWESSCSNDDCLNDGDRICDTPPKPQSGMSGAASCGAPANSCSTDEDDTSTNNPYRSVALGGLGDQPDMLANYMDYTGGCWDSFTLAQRSRMRASAESRAELIANTEAIQPQPIPANDAGIGSLSKLQDDRCAAGITLGATLHNYGSATLTSAGLEVLSGELSLYSADWSGNVAAGASTSVELGPFDLTLGESLLTVVSSQPNGASDANLNNDANYESASYIGGTSCNVYDGCSDFNPSTASGPGNPTLIDLVASFAAASPSTQGVQICVTTEGDVSSGSEVFTVLDEGGADQATTNSGIDCGGATAPACFTGSITSYESWRGDGSIRVTLDPTTTSINPNLCVTNRACAEISVPEGCPANLGLNGAASGTYQASDTVTVAGNFAAGADVELIANSRIQLLSGFSIASGATLQATLGGACP